MRAAYLYPVYILGAKSKKKILCLRQPMYSQKRRRKKLIIFAINFACVTIFSPHGFLFVPFGEKSKNSHKRSERICPLKFDNNGRKENMKGSATKKLLVSFLENKKTFFACGADSFFDQKNSRTP